MSAPIFCMTFGSMILILPVLLLFGLTYEMDLLRPLAPWSQRLRTICIYSFDHPNNPDDLSASFICGKKITQSKHKILLQKSGIYHAIVVSGGHFLFIDTVLKRAAFPTSFRFLLLILYYLISGLQPPGLRSLTHMGLAAITQQLNLKTNNLSLCFFSGLVCLLISFPLWNSLSFWLSFTVSMALCFSRDFIIAGKTQFNLLMSLFFIYVFLLPFNWTSGFLHPLNLVLGALLLYPFCWTVFLSALLIIPAHIFESSVLYFIIDQIHRWLYIILEQCSLIITNKNTKQLQLFPLWVYILLLISVFHLITLYHRRQTIHE